MKDYNLPIATFLYGGFTKKTYLAQDGRTLVIDEHKILKNTKPRYPNHEIHYYALPDVQNDKLVFDGKYTTLTGWEDRDREVMKRYMRIARYCGINTFFFNLYGGKKNKNSKLELIMENPLKNFLELPSKEEFKMMRFAPVLCSSLPRRELPIIVPVEDGKDAYRFIYANKESVWALVDYFLRQYFMKYNNNFLTIDDRPVILFFDLPRLGIWQKYNLDPQNVSRLLHSIKKFSKAKYKVEPYFIAVEDKLDSIRQTLSMGIDACTYYTNLAYYSEANSWPIQDYKKLIQRREKDWEKIYSHLSNPTMFIPAQLSGFDASSRVAYSGQGKIIKNKPYINKNYYPLIPHIPWNEKRPKLFRKYLRKGIKNVVDRKLPFLNLGPFNEMTEQCSILPFYNQQSNTIDATILTIVKEEIEKLAKG